MRQTVYALIIFIVVLFFTSLCLPVFAKDIPINATTEVSVAGENSFNITNEDGSRVISIVIKQCVAGTMYWKVVDPDTGHFSTIIVGRCPIREGEITGPAD